MTDSSARELADDELTPLQEAKEAVAYIKSQLGTRKDWELHDFQDFYQRDVGEILLPLVEMQFTALDEIRRLFREKVDANTSPGVCGYCLLPIEPGIDAGRAHTATCKENPLVRECDDLSSRLSECQAGAAAMRLALTEDNGGWADLRTIVGTLAGGNGDAHKLANGVLQILGERP